MGRKQPAEQFYTKYKYIPYVDWVSWMKLLNNMDVGINVTRRTGAETFNLNCQYLGIPLLDTEDIKDGFGAYDKLWLLLEDYERESKEQIEQFDRFETEEYFLKRMNNMFKEIL